MQFMKLRQVQNNYNCYNKPYNDTLAKGLKTLLWALLKLTRCL